jgi:hypothetical protein
MLIQLDKVLKICCVGMIFVVIGCPKADEELDVINISNTPGRSEEPAIAADSRGYFYVVWEERAPNEILDIYMAERPPTGDWTQPAYILEPQTPQRQPEIAVDNENTLHVVGQYTNAEGWGEVLYTKKTLAGDWTTPEIIGMYGMACVPDLAVDNSGNVHIVWRELVGSWPTCYAKKDANGSWSMPVEISNGDVFARYDLNIAVDLQGHAHVVWEETKTDIGPDCVIYTTNALEDTWSYPTVIALDSLLEISGPQIAVDNDGIVHVVWTQDGDIFYTFKDINSQWQTPVRIYSTATYSARPCLVEDTDGSLHLVWYEYNKLYYTSKSTGNDWAEPKVYTTDIGIYSPKLAISTNNVGIVFSGVIEPDPAGEDNYEVFFVEIPKN